MSVVLSAVFLFGQSFASQRARGEYELYATLPIRKITFISGTLIANLIMSLINVILLILIAKLVFGFDIKPTLWIIPSITLGATSVVGIGLLVGILSKGPGQAALICNVLVYILSYATPVFYPLESLSPGLRTFAFYLPTTQASASINNTLAGGSMPFDATVILLVWTVVLLSIVTTQLDWRLR